MAAPFKSSVVTASTDVNLDFLTKEEREALLNQKMDMIRQRNKALSERHQMIEADKKKAEDSGQAVKGQPGKGQPQGQAGKGQGQPAKPVDNRAPPAAEVTAPKAKGRGRGQPQSQGQTKEGQRPSKERPKSTGNFRDANYNDSTMESMEVRYDSRDQRGGGRGGHRGQDVEHTPKNRRKPYNKEEEASPPFPSSGSFEYEPIVDMTDLDNRFGRLATSSDHNNTRAAKHVQQFPLDLKITISNTPSQPHHPPIDKSAQGQGHGGQGHGGQGQSNFRGNNRRQEDSDGRGDRVMLRNDRQDQHGDRQDQRGDRHDQAQRDRDNRGDRAMRRKEGGGGNRPKSFPNDQPSAPLYEGRLRGDLGPPPDPTFNPLADSRRVDKRMSAGDPSSAGDNRGDPRRDQRRQRDPHNYGGGADLGKVKQIMKTQREKEKEAPSSPRPLDISMTGRERRNHEDWRRERERCDRERMQRNTGEGQWRRAWDSEKVPGEYDDSSKDRRHQEPAKRPAPIK